MGVQVHELEPEGTRRGPFCLSSLALLKVQELSRSEHARCSSPWIQLVVVGASCPESSEAARTDHCRRAVPSRLDRNGCPGHKTVSETQGDTV